MTDNAPRQLSEEEVKDIETRIKGFNDDLIPLLKKWELGLGASAFLLPDGRIAARPQVFNDKKYDQGGDEAVAAPATPAPEGELAKSE